ncbi:8386_t:CDS:2 [Gigaspora margarita]|uniref:8386_t:CDS:1 n=1 Tax=Gigaspora margarita TaxID=4874 RepID=A0ABN7VIY8_GIGMA|nr:8386_t:CDS:2 [Gigaspora margarita]
MNQREKTKIVQNTQKRAQESYCKDLLKNNKNSKDLYKIESFKRKLILQAELNEELKEAILVALNRNSNCQQRRLQFYTNGLLQKKNKDDNSIAVMGTAAVQENKKEEVALKEILAYITSWASLSKAELLVIWLAVLIFTSRAEVIVKTDSAILITNIKSTKHIAISRLWLKQKNVDLLVLIRKTVAIKEIKLSLIEVKEHSNNRWIIRQIS